MGLVPLPGAGHRLAGWVSDGYLETLIKCYFALSSQHLTAGIFAQFCSLKNLWVQLPAGPCSNSLQLFEGYCTIAQNRFNHERKPRQFFARRILAWMSWFDDEASMKYPRNPRVAPRYSRDDTTCDREKRQGYPRICSWNIIQECEFGSGNPSRSKMWMLPLFLPAAIPPVEFRKRIILWFQKQFDQIQKKNCTNSHKPFTNHVTNGHIRKFSGCRAAPPRCPWNLT